MGIFVRLRRWFGAAAPEEVCSPVETVLRQALREAHARELAEEKNTYEPR